MQQGAAEVREWAEAEEKLYPVVTVRPDLYEVCARVVRALADHLSQMPDVDALAATFRSTSFEQDAAAAGITQNEVPPDLNRDLVRGAAYALSAREVAKRGTTSTTRRAIERARRAGDATATVWSEGENELWPPYRRVEMSVRTGRAIVSSTEIDPETMVSKFFLAAIQLDPDTGESRDEEPLVPESSFTHPEDWHAAANALRISILEAE